MQPTMPPSRQTGRTRSVAAGEPVNILEHALHSSKVVTKSKSARCWSAREENKIHEAHVMQAKEPGGVSLNWSEKTMKSSQGSAHVRLHVKITGQSAKLKKELFIK